MMGQFSFLWVFSLIAAVLFGSLAFAQGTVSDFDGVGDAIITLQQFQDPVDGPGPSLQASGGNPGGFLQLNSSVTGGHQSNYATFDQTEVGAPSASTFGFDFRFDQLINGGADGFSFLYYNTAIFPDNGNIPADRVFTEENPAAAGVLGFAFDTWNNGLFLNDPPSGSPSGSSEDYSEISVFFSGALIAQVDDTRVLPVEFDLKDGVFHSVTGDVDFEGGTINLSVDGNAIFTNLSVPGIAPFEFRNGFAGRTGGASERVSIDNVSVFVAVPEPATLAICGIGLIFTAAVRGRKKADHKFVQSVLRDASFPGIDCSNSNYRRVIS